LRWRIGIELNCGYGNHEREGKRTGWTLRVKKKTGEIDQ